MQSLIRDRSHSDESIAYTSRPSTDRDIIRTHVIICMSNTTFGFQAFQTNIFEFDLHAFVVIIVRLFI